MDQITHRFVATNGVELHVAEVGLGPAVLLLHGFPEIWYSWRHQMLGLARAGFRAIAPDHRGYGLSRAPPSSSSSADYFTVVDDVVGLMDALALSQVFVVGKDWGSFITYALGFLHPDRVLGLVVLGSPLSKPGRVNLRDQLPNGHYIKRWAQTDLVEKDFGRFDVATIIKRIYILFCNSHMPIASEDEHILDLVKSTDTLPSWLDEDDLKVYAELYRVSGFEDAMQVPYRSFPMTLQKLALVEDLTIQAPIMLIVGGSDYSTRLSGVELNLNELKLDLMPKSKVEFIKDGGHFVQEQFPTIVSNLIVSFFGSITFSQRL